ncbi:MAG: hypothetical protein ACYCXP_07185 [Leptospirillum sp.]
MSAIPFTDRELKRAWRELSTIATPVGGSPCMNPHRLMLFYAVECGLKAVWLKRKNLNLFNREDIDRTGHNLRLMLKELKVGNLLLPLGNMNLLPITQNNSKVLRNGDINIMHQAWRYGGKCVAPTDYQCERELRRVLNWIQGELK